MRSARLTTLPLTRSGSKHLLAYRLLHQVLRTSRKTYLVAQSWFDKKIQQQASIAGFVMPGYVGESYLTTEMQPPL